MNINEASNGDQITLSVSGRVDTTTAPDLQTSITNAFEKSADLVIDFSEVEYISSAGLRALLFGQKTAQSKNGSMVVTNVTDAVKEVLDITGFSNILTIQ